MKKHVGTGGSVGPAGSTTGLSLGDVEEKVYYILAFPLVFIIFEL